MPQEIFRQIQNHRKLHPNATFEDFSDPRNLIVGVKSSEGSSFQITVQNIRDNTNWLKENIPSEMLEMFLNITRNEMFNSDAFMELDLSE
jgi:hypothetical protein